MARRHNIDISRTNGWQYVIPPARHPQAITQVQMSSECLKRLTLWPFANNPKIRAGDHRRGAQQCVESLVLMKTPNSN